MKAIILAAGMGTRLRPLTESCPKCLVDVCGKPIMEYQLESLQKAGIGQCTMVVGYKSESVRQRFGNNYRGIKLSYVENHRYAETNNMYSLWLAKSKMDDDILLLESDLIFDDRLLQELIWDHADNVAVVDRYRPTMDGTVILSNAGVVDAMVLKARQGLGFDYATALKTVNIYKLSQETLTDWVVPAMDSFLSRERTDQYYEVVFSNLIDGGRLDMGVFHMGSRRWAEVDTLEDLRIAEEMFAAPPASVR